MLLTCQSDEKPLGPAFSRGSHLTYRTSANLYSTSEALHVLGSQVLL